MLKNPFKKEAPKQKTMAEIKAEQRDVVLQSMAAVPNANDVFEHIKATNDELIKLMEVHAGDAGKIQALAGALVHGDKMYKYLTKYAKNLK